MLPLFETPFLHCNNNWYRETVTWRTGLTVLLQQHTVSGTITSQGSALAGITLNGLPGNPLTDAPGNYSAAVDYG
ncbi:MAG: hypothetical protein GY765_26655 [bacterium]|nr:hypothetical protein [bacterium]